MGIGERSAGQDRRRLPARRPDGGILPGGRQVQRRTSDPRGAVLRSVPRPVPGARYGGGGPRARRRDNLEGGRRTDRADLAALSLIVAPPALAEPRARLELAKVGAKAFNVERSVAFHLIGRREKRRRAGAARSEP